MKAITKFQIEQSCFEDSLDGRLLYANSGGEIIKALGG